ncbi:MAG: mammalian cell entry protein [Actinomycetota bacterium]|uniref:Mammalian cell entry protein n=1 Tax=Mycobacterium lentiflavum TaxID=141349 RepID=A0ABY3V015_MYCLN|nr:mammalian cell entry protein [Mycobacterium lentiflavum]MEE3063549.1 mammalian cell entry protein [Actinomycetota bacterium]ULP42807.1 mammalian cell entry protein [Mycobacterium lentiflavum]
MEDKQPAAGDLTAEAASDDAAEHDENTYTATESAKESAKPEERDADADESAAAAQEGGRKRRKLLAGKWMAIVVVVAALLFVGSAAFAGAAMQPYLADRATAATKLNVARTAANAITTLWTYTPENMDSLADRASAYLSGDFEAQYRKFVDAIVAPNKQAKITNRTQVTGAAVESLDGPNAVVIVYTNTTSTSPLTKDIPALKYLSYRLFMKRANGRWLVTRMTTVTSLDLTPHP